MERILTNTQPLHDDLVQALGSALPPSQRQVAPALAQALARAAEGNADGLHDPSLRPALRALAGRELSAGGTMINFQGAQTGEITIGDVAGGDLIKIALVVPSPQLNAEDRRSRRAMIQKVRAIWVGGLRDRAIAELTRLELRLSTQPGAVHRSLQEQVQELAAEPEQLPAGIVLSEYLQQCGGTLLILGAPGAGKTFLLTDLCAQLLDRAEQDETAPIPVIVNLASWARRRLPIDEWLVHELQEQYSVPMQITRNWGDGALLPLLDGLDEISVDYRDDCVRELNRFRAAQLASLVVCSRATEYQAIGVLLALDAAVLVQPLNLEAILAGLSEQSAELRPLLQALDTSAELRELARTPLMFSVLARASRSIPQAELVAGVERGQLWELYLDAMFRRRGLARYSPETTRRWLGWLAHTSQTKGESIVRVERLQPSWLAQRHHRLIYGVGEGLMAGLCAGVGAGLYFGALGLAGITPRGGLLPWAPEGPLLLLLSLANGVLMGIVGGLAYLALLVLTGGSLAPAADEAAPASGWIVTALRVSAAFGLTIGLTILPLYGGGLALVTGICFGPLAGLLTALGTQPGRIRPVERLRCRWRAALRGAVVGAVVGLVVGLALSSLAPSPLTYLGLALPSVIAFAVVFGLTGTTIDTSTRVNQGIWRSASTALVVGSGLGLAMGGLVSLFGEVMPFSTVETGLQRVLLGLIFGLATASFFALIYGAAACAQHCLLRLVLWGSRLAPLNYARFLDHCAERVLVRRVGGGYLFIHRLLQEHLERVASAEGRAERTPIAAPDSHTGG